MSLTNSLSNVVVKVTLDLSNSIKYSFTSLPPMSNLYIAWDNTYPSTTGTLVEMPSPHSSTNAVVRPSV
jgi:hypothetical protein